MCDPLTIGVGLAVTASAANVVGQIQQSKAMAKAINAQSEQQADEIRDRASGEMFDRSVQTFERIGLQRATGAQRGLNDASRTLQIANDAILFDYEFDNTRTQLNADNAQSARLAQTNAQLARASRPTLLGAGLQIIGAGANAANQAGAFD